jgi:hypothetical protein
MHIVGLIFVAGVVLKSAAAAQESNGTNKLDRFVYDRCRKYSTQASAYDEIREHLGQFTDYLKYTASLLPQGQEQFCKDEKGRLISLFANLVRDLKPCFPKEEQYLPKFMHESFIAFMFFACADGNIKNFFSSQGADCRRALKVNQAGNEVSNCFDSLFGRLDDVVRKDDLCRDLESAQKCFGMAIARSCPNFAGYESLNKKFFHAIRKPCNSDVSFGAGSLVLLISAYISTKILS